MFSFLNRTKNQSYNATSASAQQQAVPPSTATNNAVNDTLIKPSGEANGSTSAKTLEAHLTEVRKNFLEAILLRRTDIVVSLINEWFKG